MNSTAWIDKNQEATLKTSLIVICDSQFYEIKMRCFVEKDMDASIEILVLEIFRLVCLVLRRGIENRFYQS
jgi:hypothetical protein